MSFRIIGRLDVKSEFLIKGVRFEGLRKIGDPAVAAEKYFRNGIDELILVDNVASVYGRSHLGPLLERVAKTSFVPLTAAGGIRTLEDAQNLFASGADKVGVNTATFNHPQLISEIANKFGAQAVMGSIQARREGGTWICLAEQGRERTGWELGDRIHELVSLGVGELLVTSIDNDGVQGGFDLELAIFSAEASTVPVIIGGGCGNIGDVTRATAINKLSGVALGSALHYDKLDLGDLKNSLRVTKERESGFGVE